MMEQAFRGFEAGSSPRVRRTLTPLANHVILNRFISARAENTPFEISTLYVLAVHLRACGEHAQT